ncbi:hypothetical protein [uncultured Enterococcus sp.]|uniref:hypothetical protein n=1 Tax=uncultured Enterococcus sp. TaxID=167972 RepID=UPI002AA61B01|nr:hypothetical protein [uncultured Enterococcus sp.]
MCETCRTRTLLEKQYPDKIIGMQYAALALGSEDPPAADQMLLVSAEEIGYLWEELGSDPQMNAFDSKGKSVLTVAYGIYLGKKDAEREIKEIVQARGCSYMYFEREKEQLQEVRLLDLCMHAMEKNKVKVVALIESNEPIRFPSDQGELAVTFSKYLPELGATLTELIFSRKEYGVFRLDIGHSIPHESSRHWYGTVDQSMLNETVYDRFLLIDEEGEGFK